MSRTLQFKRIKTRLAFWFLAVTMSSSIVIVTILYFQRSKSIYDREINNIQTIRDLKVRELNGWLEERIGDLGVIAGDGEIRKIGQIFSKEKSKWTPQDSKDIRIAQGLLQRYVDHYDAYWDLSIINASSGKVEVSTIPSHVGVDKRDDLNFAEVMRTKKLYIKDVYYSKTIDAVTMCFSTPLFSLTEAGKVDGVLVTRINLENSLFPLLLERTGQGKTGETLIVNNDAIAINKLRWDDSAPLKLKISAKPAVRAAAGETGIIKCGDYRGEMVLAAYTHIPMTGWGFVAKRDVSELYAPIHDMLWDMIAILGLTALVVVGVALLLAKTISRPILAVGETVRQIASGKLDARYTADGIDEVAVLGATFNKMAENIASQITVQRGGGEIAETMTVAGDVESFASSLLIKLLDITDSQLGAFYLLSEDEQRFEHITSLGLSADAAPSFDADIREGEFGRTLTTGKISHIYDIPQNTVFTFKMTAGTAIPQEIVTIPFMVGGKTMAVASLATLGEYTEEHHIILNQAQIGMNIAFSNLVASDKTTKMAEELRATNQNLASLNEELQAQTEELQAQAEELQNQTEELDVQRLQVEEANRLKSDFLSNMSHELRTPLNSVMALSQLMLSRGTGKDPAQEAEYLQVIDRNGRQLLSLINDILDLSKIEAGRLDVSLSQVIPQEVVESALATIRPLAEEKDLSLSVKAADDMPEMHSDADKIRQILLNLLSNAVKFTEAGEIKITISAEEDSVTIAVSDSGLGIDPENFEHIFDEFRQVDGSTTRKHGGTGLGLAICRRLSRLLGGDIVVQCEPNQGSKFILTLPLQAPADQVAEGEAQPISITSKPVHARSQKVLATGNRADAPPADKPHILVVEDNEVAALQIRTTLEENGYHVVVASGGADGLEAVKRAVPDGMILDLMMPDVDGFTVLEEIRSTPWTTTLPVLILTAKELTRTDLARLKENNIQQLVQKGSVDREDLIGLVNKMVGKNSAKPSAVKSDRPEQEARETIQPASPGQKFVLAAPGKTVMVVEDHSDNLLTIKAVLTEIGVDKIIVAADGQEAVTLASQAKPDMIIMDVQLPILNGLDATRQIKAKSETKNIPIVVLTAKAMKGDRKEALAAGCDEYLTKPLCPHMLNEITKKWLQDNS